jgi:hypothetical protein
LYLWDITLGWLSSSSGGWVFRDLIPFPTYINSFQQVFKSVTREHHIHFNDDAFSTDQSFG